MSQNLFRKNLLEWHAENPREMPWAGIKDPYKIWISEIILQQTRVAQGWDYYLKFIDRFPDIFSLASANEDEVLKYWEGLGYYSRARNLLKAAKKVQEEFNGVFPNTYEEIISLSGIGPYTAAAISSFAFGLRYPVLDGNVLRVISRYTSNDGDILSQSTKKVIMEYLQEIMKKVKDPAEFNQAIMNFGAMQCVPSSPDCGICPMQKSCLARKEGIVDMLPVKIKKIKKKKRYLNFYDLQDGEGNRLIVRREKKDIWQGLYEFLMVESDTVITPTLKQISKTFDESQIRLKGKIMLHMVHEYKHQLTHQTIYAKVFSLKCIEIKESGPEMIITNSLSGYAFPKLLDLYLQENKVNYD